MIKIICLFSLILILGACSSTKENFAQCILDNMPGTGNNQIRGMVYTQCREQHPDMYNNIKKGSGRGILAYENSRECTLNFAKDTLNSGAVTNIKHACSCLYDKPSLKDQRCTYPKSQFDPSTARAIIQ